MIGPLTEDDYEEYAPGKGRVYVYRNLRQDCWSVKALTGTRSGRVIAHMRTFHIYGPLAFRVSEAGRQRVLRTGRKSVHAGIVGHLAYLTSALHQSEAHCRYNPRTQEHFTNLDGRELVGGHIALFHLTGVKILEPIYRESCTPTT